MYTTSPPDCTKDLRIAKEILSLNGTKPKIGIILGTGWNGCISKDETRRCSLSRLPSFENLCELKGHARELVFTQIAETDVILLNGRVHLNESPCDPHLPVKVRLQTDILCSMGIKLLILTNAAGRLNRGYDVGDIMFAKQFITLFAPPMPLWAGEFISPESTVDYELIRKINHEIAPNVSLKSHIGRYAMVRGPLFEGPIDKAALRNFGADAVGMSTLPEVCVAALHSIKTIPISFISNTEEEHSHEQNMIRVMEAKNHLSSLLTEIVRAVSQNF